MKKSLALAITTLLILCPIFSQQIPIVKVAYFKSIPMEDYYARIIPKEYLALVFKASADYQIPLYILTALIYVESRFDKNAVNYNSGGRGTDQGLMQLNSRNYAEFKWRFNNGRKYDPFDPKTNLRIGCKYLVWIYNNPYIGKGSWYNTLVFWNGSKESSKTFAKFILCVS